MMILVILAGISTGILLGLMGSGGSIATVPALLYLLAVQPKPAIALSLGIVSITAAISAIQHFRAGNVNLKVAAIFGVCGILGTYAGTKLGVRMSAVLQLGLFAMVMYIAAYKMLKPKYQLGVNENDVIRNVPGIALPEKRVTIHFGYVALLGLAVGVLTGLVGVGGGFLIIPALVLFAGIDMKQAIGTSLVVVAINSATGFIGYLGIVPVDYKLMLTFTSVAIAGSFIGAKISRYISSDQLKRGFGIFLIIVASYILIKSVIL